MARIGGHLASQLYYLKPYRIVTCRCGAGEDIQIIANEMTTIFSEFGRLVGKPYLNRNDEQNVEAIVTFSTEKEAINAAHHVFFTGMSKSSRKSLNYVSKAFLLTSTTKHSRRRCVRP